MGRRLGGGRHARLCDGMRALRRPNDTSVAFAARLDKTLLNAAAAEGGHDAGWSADASGAAQVRDRHHRPSGFAPAATPGHPNRWATGDPGSHLRETGPILLAEDRANARLHVSTKQNAIGIYRAHYHFTTISFRNGAFQNGLAVANCVCHRMTSP